jgi:hypothetical protein
MAVPVSSREFSRTSNSNLPHFDERLYHRQSHSCGEAAQSRVQTMRTLGGREKARRQSPSSICCSPLSPKRIST